jgi:hypothetical protein
MKIILKLGEIESTEVIIERNWFTGYFTYSVNDEKQTIRSPLDETTHFSTKQKNSYVFEVGQPEKYKILIEHTRALMLGGILPQKFDVFVNGDLYTSYKGY